ncbi:MAG: type II toxin-antitoxin system RelE/ParE family toxin [Bdellovibrionales bacterium]|nr:type II toxin-antitoxin system RelE/ParE family toxin [Bdellovibrionales bacterium]
MKAVDFHPAALKVIKEFPVNVRKVIGQAILALQKGERLSMPLSRPVKSVGSGVEEIRSKDSSGIYRTFYLARMKDRIIVFHAFIKKTQKTPKKEIKTAKKRLKEVFDG